MTGGSGVTKHELKIKQSPGSTFRQVLIYQTPDTDRFCPIKHFASIRIFRIIRPGVFPIRFPVVFIPKFFLERIWSCLLFMTYKSYIPCTILCMCGRGMTIDPVEYLSCGADQLTPEFFSLFLFE